MPHGQARPSSNLLRAMSRRSVVIGATGAVGTMGALYGLSRRFKSRLANLTQHKAFTAAPPRELATAQYGESRVYVSQNLPPAAAVDSVVSKLGGIQAKVGADDVVIIKVSAQWWNQGMTNVAAVKRVLEHIVERPGGFFGEVIVFENTHFRMSDGSGLSRAWVCPSVRNVDVPGWNKLGDLIPYFEKLRAPVSFVGLVDGGFSALADDDWHDATHEFGVYGGDGRGPIERGSTRDGYHWDFDNVFELPRSPFDVARCVTTWPRFTSPRSGLVVDLRDGVLRRTERGLEPTGRKLTWINMTTANEHGATGLTAATKSTMGVVDMSAGELGTHPLCAGYRSVHYFGKGAPSASWRMAGPLAHFANTVRAPDLILTVAHWVAFTPSAPLEGDIRMEAASAALTQTLVAGDDPVAIDAWLCRHVMPHVQSVHFATKLDVDNDESSVAKFLRYFVQVRGKGALAPTSIVAV